MGKINFRIVEVSESEHNYDEHYEDFKKDFMNPMMQIDDLMTKYDIPPYIYKRWSKEIKEEYNLIRKPTHKDTGFWLDGLKENQNIYQLKDSWGIRKKINGEVKYFGKYKNLSTARMVRDKLFECKFDEKIAEELIREYEYVKPIGIKPDKLMGLYDEFKHLYLDVPTKYEEILKQLNINSHAYNWLRARLREEYGRDVKKNKLRCYDPNHPFKRNRKVKPKPNKVKSRPKRYIHVNSNGKYEIIKVINGKQKYFGCYSKLGSAIRKRNKLEANGWQV